MGDFTTHLVGLRERLAHLVDGGLDSAESEVVVADLETAYEELRVADEEVRSQHDEIAQLLAGYADLERQQDRMLAALPVAAVVTDNAGAIRSVNAAAALLLGLRVSHLLGKPLLVFLHPDHRREVRDLLSRPRGRGTTRTRSVLAPRRGGPVEVALTLVQRPGNGAVLTWLLLPLGAEGPPGLDLIPEVLTELAGLPALGADLQDVLNRAAALCLRALGPLEVSVTMGQPTAPHALAATSRVAQHIDGAQVTAGQGPCATAFETRAAVRSPDVGGDPRWPRLARLLPDDQVSVVAVPIEVGTRLVGALNVYAVQTAIEPWVEDAVELLAATLGAVFYELELTRELADLAEHMERALASRATIEQAKGIVMGQRRCSADEAFQHLRRLSSSQERKLRDVAAAIVAQVSGEA